MPAKPYPDWVIENAQSCRNAGIIRAPQYRAELSNPVCGDSLSLALNIDKAGKISVVQYQADACAFVCASAALLAGWAVTVDAAEAGFVAEQIIPALQQRQFPQNLPLIDEQFPQLLPLADVQEFPIRIKCALLPWHALLKALRA